MATAEDTVNYEAELFSSRYAITELTSDALRWTKDWDRILGHLSFQDVYTAFKARFDSTCAHLPAHSAKFAAEDMYDHVAQLQTNAIVLMWDRLMMQDHFFTAWMLWEKKDRQMHILNGLNANTRYGVRIQGHSLCAEIALSAMLKQKGRALGEFIQHYHRKLKEKDPEMMCALPNKWWASKAKDKTMLQFLTANQE